MIHFPFSRRLICACSVILMLNACMGLPQETKKPVITFVPASHDVFYPRYTVIPSDSEEAALDEFLGETAHNPGGNIALLTASPDEEKTSQRLTDLRAQLSKRGYHEIVVLEDSTVPESRIRVSASKAHVNAPDCPDWTYAHMANYRNTVLSNHGCAHAVALTKMVENPHDLVSGKGDSGADALRGQGIIETYRAPPAAPATTGGASQIGGM